MSEERLDVVPSSADLYGVKKLGSSERFFHHPLDRGEVPVFNGDPDQGKPPRCDKLFAFDVSQIF